MQYTIPYNTKSDHGVIACLLCRQASSGTQLKISCIGIQHVELTSHIHSNLQTQISLHKSDRYIMQSTHPALQRQMSTMEGRVRKSCLSPSLSTALMECEAVIHSLMWRSNADAIILFLRGADFVGWPKLPGSLPIGLRSAGSITVQPGLRINRGMKPLLSVAC